MATEVRERLEQLRAKLASVGAPAGFVALYERYYAQLDAGADGKIAESSIEPAADLDRYDDLDEATAAVGREALGRTVMLKLNGGLGTGMGLRQAKSLLPLRGGKSFLQIIGEQSRACGCPLVLMNSFATERDSLEELAPLGLDQGAIPLSFVQHQAPKIAQADLLPVAHPADPALEWYPPGHGDLYAALQTRGVLDALLDAGRRYAFVSNADNVGATVDPRLLGYLIRQGAPFLMEVARRTEADKKGGHLARRAGDGQLILREVAQCPEADLSAFQDVQRHGYFNTNSLWLDLAALRDQARSEDGAMTLPLIVNRKTVDPRDPSSTGVFQLETAMGSAIATFPGACAVEVPRSRFAPVKGCNDLMLVRSDLYRVTDDSRVLPVEPGQRLPIVDLDPRFYKFCHDLEARFRSGPPSLRRASRFVVRGDVRFGAGIVIDGDVEIHHEGDEPAWIPDGTRLSGSFSP